jgi:dihydrolipoamide dehydrogenase
MAGHDRGYLRVYAEPSTARVLGAELCAPQGEHLAHLLAWAVQRRLTVFDILELPFYHPTVEEALRTAMRDVKRHCGDVPQRPELPMCEGLPFAGLD